MRIIRSPGSGGYKALPYPGHGKQVQRHSEPLLPRVQIEVVGQQRFVTLDSAFSLTASRAFHWIEAQVKGGLRLLLTKNARTAIPAIDHVIDARRRFHSQPTRLTPTKPGL